MYKAQRIYQLNNVEMKQIKENQTNIFDPSNSNIFDKSNWKHDVSNTLNTQVTERETTNDSKLTSDSSHITSLIQIFDQKQLELRAKTQRVLSSDRAKQKKEKDFELAMMMNKALKEQIQSLNNKI